MHKLLDADAKSMQNKVNMVIVKLGTLEKEEAIEVSRCEAKTSYNSAYNVLSKSLSNIYCNNCGRELCAVKFIAAERQ